MKYRIKQEDEIILYGYNAYCKEQVDWLIKGGYTVIGILDRNPQNKGRYRGIPIECSLDELDISEEVCVFVMLQDGMLHWNIALDLYKHGLNRVVFLPMKIGFYNNDVQDDLIIQYNYMIEGQYSVMQMPYLCDAMFELTNVADWNIAKRLNASEYIVWISVNLIRTTLQEQKNYRDIPIVDFIPYINLFSYLSGNSVDISEYIKMYGKAPYDDASEEARDYVLNKRCKLFDFFEEKFNSGDMGYFVAAAPKAVWNKNGYLNLCEGQHRCVYLYMRGMKKVPVRMNQITLDNLRSIER